MSSTEFIDVPLPTPHDYEVSFSRDAFKLALSLYGEEDIASAISEAHRAHGEVIDVSVLSFFHDWATVLSNDGRYGHEKCMRFNDYANTIDVILEEVGATIN